MPIHEATFGDVQVIDSYGPGFFRISGRVWQGGVVVHGGAAAPWAGYGDTAPLLALVDELDVLFVGTGADIARPPAVFRAAMEAGGLMIEPMGTPSAARTYNVLLSEGRRIGAALLPMPGAPVAAG